MIGKYYERGSEADLENRTLKRRLLASFATGLVVAGLASLHPTEEIAGTPVCDPNAIAWHELPNPEHPEMQILVGKPECESPYK